MDLDAWDLRPESSGTSLSQILRHPPNLSLTFEGGNQAERISVERQTTLAVLCFSSKSPSASHREAVRLSYYMVPECWGAQQSGYHSHENSSAVLQDTNPAMTDYERQVRFYVEDETRKQTEAYFEKYWLAKGEYKQKWLSIQEGIYDVSGPNFPDVRFRSGFEVITIGGGRVFTEEDFSLLKECIQEAGDSYFVVVEHVDEDNPHHGEPPLRFRYPSSVTWDELMAGGYVSQELFETPLKEYFVFGDTGTWGKYVANDYIYPLDLIGFEKKYSKLFRDHFEPLIGAEVSKWIPPIQAD
jgi:hypothetical protein